MVLRAKNGRVSGMSVAEVANHFSNGKIPPNPRRKRSNTGRFDHRGGGSIGQRISQGMNALTASGS